MFRWFATRNDFMHAVRDLDAYRSASEAWIETKDTVPGYCVRCKKITQLQVEVGGYYGKHPNLREAMACAECGLSNRTRLLYQAAISEAACMAAPQVAMLERLSVLFGALQQAFPTIIGSEDLGNDKLSGATYAWQGVDVRHESLESLSFAPESLDLLLHSDMLEHVCDYRGALARVASVLKPHGGTMLCTVPFFMTRGESLALARPKSDGSVEFLNPPEYHGHHLRPEGVLTWHHFGWGLLQDATDAGFSSAEIGMVYDPFRGFTTNNHPNADYGLMYPLVFRARR